MKSFIVMLSLVIALLSRLNVSRLNVSRLNASNVKRGVSDFSLTTTFTKLDLSTGIPIEDSLYVAAGLVACYWLDYDASITLTMNGTEYKNPLFYCPKNTSDIKFEPEDAEIYYAAMFDLSSLSVYTEYIESMYISTKASSFKTPQNEVVNGALYYDLILVPIPSYTVALEYSSGDFQYLYSEDGGYAITMGSSKNSATVTFGVKTSSDYTIKNEISGRYKIDLPADGPYAYVGVSASSSGSGSSSTGVIVGVVIAVVVVVGIVGFCVYWFIIRKKTA